MPRVNAVSQREQRRRNVRAAIAGYIQKENLANLFGFAKRVGIPYSTLNRKYNEPDKFTMENLWQISERTGMSISELTGYGGTKHD